MNNVSKFVLTVAIILTGFATFVVAGQSVSTLEGDKFEGEIISLDSKKLVLKTSKGNKEISAGGLSVLQLNEVENSADNINQSLVLTFVGDVIPVSNMNLAGSELAFKSEKLGTRKLKLNTVSTLVNSNDSLSPLDILERCRAKKYSNGSRDKVIVQKNADNWKSFSCAISSMDSKKLKIKYKRKKRSLKMGKVIAVMIGKPTEKLPEIQGTVTLVDGTKLTFKTVEISKGKLTVDTINFGRLVFDSKNVGRIKILSDKLVNLSDLKPVEFKSYDMFNKQYDYKNNLSVSGRKLSLDNKEYSNGIGLHAFAELTYDLGGKYSKFVSLVGINDKSRPQGKVVVEVIGDGKLIKKIASLTGNDKAVKLNLNVTGVKKLTLRVSPGADNITVGDHVDFVNAKLIK